MRCEEAAARASELNRELGERGEQRAYYMEVETSPGVWSVEMRREPEEKPSWWRRALDAVISSGGP